MTTLATTSDAILASARSFIIAGGYNGFSYADISNVVGIRKASIHHHFPGKVDLVRILVRQYREAAEAGLGELAANAPDELTALELFAGNWEQCITDASQPFCVCALLASELPALPPEVALEVSAYFRVLSSWLTNVMERGRQVGTLKLDAAAKVEAEMFMASVHGAMLSARAQQDPALFGLILAPTLRRLTPDAR
jgi:TetR/AcrR family transcriptional repressor of nem operon